MGCMSWPKAAASECYPNHPGPPRSFARAAFSRCTGRRLGAYIKTKGVRVFHADGRMT